MSLPHLKGIRTRFCNLLGKELNNAKDLQERDFKVDGIDSLLRRVSTSLVKFQQYKEKYESTCEKLTAITEDIENEEEKEKMTDENEKHADFLCEVIEAHCELTGYEQFLKEQNSNTGQRDSKLEELLAVQTKLMHQLVTTAQEKHGETSAHGSVKLPKLEIPHFDGNILKFRDFWDAFEVCVDSNRRLAAVEKFTYLKSKLQGDALKAVDGLSLNNGNYTVAVRILKERFGDEQDVISAHYRGLMNVQIPTSHSTQALRKLVMNWKNTLGA